jgi:hypothetical protein
MADVFERESYIKRTYLVKERRFVFSPTFLLYFRTHSAQAYALETNTDLSNHV